MAQVVITALGVNLKRATSDFLLIDFSHEGSSGDLETVVCPESQKLVLETGLNQGSLGTKAVMPPSAAVASVPSVHPR